MYVHYPGEYVTPALCRRHPTTGQFGQNASNKVIDKYSENDTVSILPELSTKDRTYFSLENVTFMWNIWYDKTIFNLLEKATTFCVIFGVNNPDMFEMRNMHCIPKEKKIPSTTFPQDNSSTRGGAEDDDDIALCEITVKKQRYKNAINGFVIAECEKDFQSNLILCKKNILIQDVMQRFFVLNCYFKIVDSSQPNLEYKYYNFNRSISFLSALIDIANLSHCRHTKSIF